MPLKKLRITPTCLIKPDSTFTLFEKLRELEKSDPNFYYNYNDYEEVIKWQKILKRQSQLEKS